MAEFTQDELEGLVAGKSEQLDVHLHLVERDVALEGHAVKIHCHCLTVDGNGLVQPARLAEFMRNAIVDYAVPRSRRQQAKDRDNKEGTTTAVVALAEEARRTFTDLKKTGEGGEMLLFLLAERFLKLPQILCKMDLKTDERMHYHGADGVYAGVTQDGTLKLYWGESKIYTSAADAISACLASLAPFLVEPESEEAERERDLVLLSDKADLSDPQLTASLRRYFDKTSPMSKRVQYCGVALVGFDAEFYPTTGKAVADVLVAGAKTGLEAWKERIGSRLKAHNLDEFEVDFFCIPLPSADKFREAFLKALGLGK